MRALALATLLASGCTIIVGDPRSDENADLSGPDLSAGDLGSIDLAGSDLAGADLATADLAGADLTGIDLLLPPDLTPPRDLAGQDQTVTPLDFSMPDLTMPKDFASGSDLSVKPCSSFTMSFNFQIENRDTFGTDAVDVAPVGSGQFAVVYTTGKEVYGAIVNTAGMFDVAPKLVRSCTFCQSPRVSRDSPSNSTLRFAVIDNGSYVAFSTDRSLGSYTAQATTSCGVAGGTTLGADVTRSAASFTTIGCSGTTTVHAIGTAGTDHTLVNANEARIVTSDSGTARVAYVVGGDVSIAGLTLSTGTLSNTAVKLVSAGATWTGLGFDAIDGTSPRALVAGSVGGQLYLGTGVPGQTGGALTLGPSIATTNPRLPVGVAAGPDYFVVGYASTGGAPTGGAPVPPIGGNYAAILQAVATDGSFLTAVQLSSSTFDAGGTQVAYDPSSKTFAATWLQSGPTTATTDDGGSSTMITPWFALLTCN